LTFALLIASLVLIIVFEAVHRRPHWEMRAKMRFGTRWHRTSLEFLGTWFVVFLIACLLTYTAPGNGGRLAAQLGSVESLQERIGVVEERTNAIGIDTTAIKADTNAIREDTGAIKDDTSAIRDQLGGLKHETSEDPRKELANIGIQWTTGAFVEALETGDARAVSLFLKGGMSAETQHNGASAVLYILQPTLPDPIPMLQLLVDSGYDPNANLVDPIIMAHWDGGFGTIPWQFEHEKLPEGYTSGSFRGPVLFWVVMLDGYLGVTDSERNVILFLLDHGADPTIPKAFLHQEIFSGSDFFSGYDELRDFIDEHS
jgi:hypothetical protein